LADTVYAIEGESAEENAALEREFTRGMRIASRPAKARHPG